MTKQALKILGTLLFLYGIFGYIFPRWGSVHFTNNENLSHVITGLLAISLSGASTRARSIVAIILTLFYLAWGIWGFTLNQPQDAKLIIRNKINLSVQADNVDNYTHVSIGLVFAWFVLPRKNRSEK